MSDAEAPIKHENYIMRSFCALIIFCIIFVHYEPCYEIFGMKAYEFVEGVGRFAMPMFFMVSGYFLYSSDGHSEKQLKRKTLRILFILVFMKVLYFALDCIYYGFNVITFDVLMEGLITMNWSSKHIWFIYFLFFVYAFHWILYRFHVDFKYAMIFGVICLLVDLFLSNVCAWTSLWEIAGVSTFNVGQVFYCFIAFFFFPFGYYLHKYKDKVDEVKTSTLVILVIIGAVMEVWEVLNFPTVPNTELSYSNLYFGSVIIAISLFALTFRVPPNRLRCRPLEFMGRTLLPWMYAFYMAVMFFIKFIVMPNFDAPLELLDAIGMIVSAILDVALAYGMYYLLLNTVGKKKAKPKETVAPAAN